MRFWRRDMLSPEIQAEILSLYYRDKRPIRSIARDLNVNRNSVRSVINRRTVSLVPTQPQRSSILDPYKETIEEILKRDALVTATSVFNHLREQGYSGGMSILKEHMRLRREQSAKAKQAFLRLEFEPAEAAQVDWGEFGDVFGDGVKIHCFAMVLCFSRMTYIEFTRSEKFEDFIRCHENAFKYFGGVPRECWYDNLATAVTERLGSLVRFNSRFIAYMGHHSIRPHACNVARGNEKGRVEDAIKYIRNNFWSGRLFKDFEDLTKQSIVWRNQVANQREHRSTRRVVRLMFETQEKPKLFKLSANTFSTDEVITKVVPSDFHLIYETNRYSVPWTLTGMPVTVRINDNQLKIFYFDRLIGSHLRSYQKHKVFTIEAHRQGLLERKPGASRVDWHVSAVKAIGPSMSEYLNLLKSGTRSLRSELSKILALSTVYGSGAVHESIEGLLRDGIVGVSSLELELKRRFNPAQVELKPEPMQFNIEKLNRVVPVTDLRRYDALLFESKNNGSAVDDVEVKDDGTRDA
jgi:transposase